MSHGLARKRPEDIDGWGFEMSEIVHVNRMKSIRVFSSQI